MNVEKSLKRRMKLKKEGDNWSWINFKYEQLGMFYLVCGILDHSERDCNVVYANPDKVIEKEYGTWLRTPAKNLKNNTGSRWLHTVSDGEQMWPGKGYQEGSSNNE